MTGGFTRGPQYVWHGRLAVMRSVLVGLHACLSCSTIPGAVFSVHGGGVQQGKRVHPEVVWFTHFVLLRCRSIRVAVLCSVIHDHKFLILRIFTFSSGVEHSSCRHLPRSSLLRRRSQGECSPCGYCLGRVGWNPPYKHQPCPSHFDYVLIMF